MMMGIPIDSESSPGSHLDVLEYFYIPEVCPLSPNMSLVMDASVWRTEKLCFVRIICLTQT